MNLGGPTTPAEVKPFLFSLFYDKSIITLPNPLRYLIARLISARRTPEATKIYNLLGGKSPLLENTNAQAQALERELGEGYKVFVAMRHATPRTEEAVSHVKAWEPDEVVLLPLYPQLSTTTTSSSIKEWHRLAEKEGLHCPTREICCYPQDSGFIEALVSKIKPVYEAALKVGHPRVLFTAHGLPEKTIAAGDPYQWQVEQTAKALVSALNIKDLDSRISYQSRVGPLKWIEPYTDKEIEDASRASRPLVIVPIAFVSEHSETLVELDIEYKELAHTNGCPGYFRVGTVDDHPAYIKGLKTLILKGDVKTRVCPPSFKGCPCAAQEMKHCA